MLKGKFITIEGGEGVGKSLFTQTLQSLLLEKSVSLVVTHEPGGTPTADALRQLFKNPFANDPLLPLTELFLVSAARIQHVGRKIIPSLEIGTWVLCDRFYDSTRVYQGYLAGITEEKVEAIISHSVAELKPDITFLLECPVEVALERMQQRKSTDLASQTAFEDRFDTAGIDYHVKLKTAFSRVADRFPERIVKVDATKSTDEMAVAAMQHLERKFGSIG